MKIEKNKNSDLYENWHTNIKVVNNRDEIYLSNNPSGCGQMILHGWAYWNNNETLKESLEYILDIIQNNNGEIKNIDYFNRLDIGSIITTAGQSYYNTEKLSILEEVGFEQISQYKNPRHNNDTQRLYIWTKK